MSNMGKTEKSSKRKAGTKTSQKRDIKNRSRVKLRPGIRAIDVSAVRRMVVWSIGECERQLDNLRNVLDVIDGLTESNTKKGKKTEIASEGDGNG